MYVVPVCCKRLGMLHVRVTATPYHLVVAGCTGCRTGHTRPAGRRGKERPLQASPRALHSTPHRSTCRATHGEAEAASRPNTAAARAQPRIAACLSPQAPRPQVHHRAGRPRVAVGREACGLPTARRARPHPRYSPRPGSKPLGPLPSPGSTPPPSRRRSRRRSRYRPRRHMPRQPT
jgi:hypothetical protein